MNDLTYDVRIYKTDIYKGKNATTYRVRWKAGQSSGGNRSASEHRRIASSPNSGPQRRRVKRSAPGLVGRSPGSEPRRT
jgi:hypothetical protein